MIYSINFTMRGSVALEAENVEVARERAKDVLTSIGGDEFTDWYNIHEFSPGLVDIHECYDDQGQEEADDHHYKEGSTGEAKGS